MSMLRRSKANENWFEKFGSSYQEFRKNRRNNQAGISQD